MTTGTAGSSSRILLDWSRLALPQVAEWLVSAGRDGAIDLSDTCVVLPGARAGRLLLWHLAELARGLGDRIVPPVVATPGALVELLGPALPRADELSRLCAWSDALAALPPAEREAFLPTAPSSLLEWFAAARSAVELADRLGGEGRTFEDAAGAAAALEGERVSHRETARWRALALAQAQVDRRLAAAGRVDPMRGAWSVLQASDGGGASRAQQPPAPRPLRCVVVALVAELNALQRALLKRFAQRGGQVRALVHADQSWAERLDELGCARGDLQPRPLETALVPDHELVVAETPADAAQAVLESVGSADSALRCTVGLLDSSFGSLVEQAGAFAGTTFRPATGRALATTEPWLALRALADWQRSAGPEGTRRAADPRDLARLPAVARWLERALSEAAADDAPPGGRDLLAAIDDAFRAVRPGGRGERRGGVQVLAALRDHVDSALRPFQGPGRPLPQWAGAVRGLLADVLAALPPDPLHGDAVAAIVDELMAWSAVPQSLAPSLDGATALRLLATRLAGQRLPAPVRRGEIEALGWLELHADDAPSMVLLGLHEGSVPRSVTADPFLPDALRRALGMPDDARAALRDEYLLAAMRRGRAAVRVVVARRGVQGDPIVASRLLLRVPGPALPARLRLLAGHTARRFAAPRGLLGPSSLSRFVVPPAPTEPVDLRSIRVTDFRAYLACPYRYWLRHRLRLEAVRPMEAQWDAAEFGTLAHAVLQRWGRDPAMRDRREQGRIAADLADCLAVELGQLAAGPLPVPAMVQAARLGERLEAFAAVQAAHRGAGWRIEHVEWELPATATLEVPDEPSIRVVGRIDRIDRHERDGRVLLLDYKTADVPLTPEQGHCRRLHDGDGTRWLDLQLPLYGRLVHADEDFDSELPPLLGYFNVPRAASGVKVAVAGWGEEELDSAMDMARWVVSMIRRGRFPMSPDFDGGGFDDFATICHSRALQASDEEDGE